MIRYLIILTTIFMIYIFIKRRYIFRSIIETFRINKVLRNNLLMIIYRLIFRKF